MILKKLDWLPYIHGGWPGNMENYVAHYIDNLVTSKCQLYKPNKILHHYTIIFIKHGFNIAVQKWSL